MKNQTISPENCPYRRAGETHRLVLETHRMGLIARLKRAKRTFYLKCQMCEFAIEEP